MSISVNKIKAVGEAYPSDAVVESMGHCAGCGGRTGRLPAYRRSGELHRRGQARQVVRMACAGLRRQAPVAQRRRAAL